MHRLGYVLEDGAFVPYEVLRFTQQKVHDETSADGMCRHEAAARRQVRSLHVSNGAAAAPAHRRGRRGGIELVAEFAQAPLEAVDLAPLRHHHLVEIGDHLVLLGETPLEFERRVSVS